MALYTVKTSQLLIATMLSAAISAGSIVAYLQWKDKQGLPEVQLSSENKCVKVVNFKNGDAYNCEDVDIVLRTYRKTSALPDVQPAANAETPSTINKKE